LLADEADLTPRTGLPSTYTSPLVGCSNPATKVSVVDLPQPVGPTTAQNSPSATVRSMLRKAWYSCPLGVWNALLAPRSSIAARGGGPVAAAAAPGANLAYPRLGLIVMASPSCWGYLVVAGRAALPAADPLWPKPHR
jgi:hypothetical protein